MANMLNKNKRNVCPHGDCRWHQRKNDTYRAAEKRATARLIRDERTTR